MHPTDAVPEPVRLIGEIVPQNRPAGSVPVSETAPPKWLTDAMVRIMLEGPFTSTGPDEVALMLKSPNLKTTVVECASVELLLAIVRV